MAPAFLTQSHGSDAQVIAVRLATAALAALLIPLTFLAARLVVPTQPWVWGAASVLPALSRGYVFNLSQVTNDALAVATGGVALLAFIVLLRARMGWRWGLIGGLVAAGAVLTKVTVYFVAIALLGVFAVRLYRDWPDRRRLLEAAGVGILVAVLVPLPWLALQFMRYHGLTPAIQPGTVSEALLPYYHLPLGQALQVMGVRGLLTFWGGEFGGAYVPFWMLWVAQGGLLLCLLGFLRPAVWRARPLPLVNWVPIWALLGLCVLVVIVLLSQVAILLGRYAYPLFPALAISYAAGANYLGRVGRWFYLAVLLFVLIMAVIGIPSVLEWSLGDCRSCPPNLLP